VLRDVDVAVDLLHVAVDPDDERLAAEEARAVRDAERLRDRPAPVADQMKRELVVGREGPVRVEAVGRDADEDDSLLLEVLPRIAERTRFLRAARRLVLRVEIEDDGLALEGRQLDVGAVVSLRREVRRRLADRELAIRAAGESCS